MIAYANLSETNYTQGMNIIGGVLLRLLQMRMTGSSQITAVTSSRRGEQDACRLPSFRRRGCIEEAVRPLVVEEEDSAFHSDVKGWPKQQVYHVTELI